MTRKIEISGELKELSSTLALLPAVNVFKVPEGYFNNFPATMLALVKEENSALLAAAAKESFTVPMGYFDQLAGNILDRIKQEGNLSAVEEIRQLSPTLADIGNRNFFTVPEGYFEGLNTPIERQSAPQAIVIEMKSNRGIVRYMAAAAITGIIGLSVFSIFNNKISNPEASPETAMVQAKEIIKNKSFDAELDKISASDIEQYLAESGQDVNAALVASATDEIALPDADEYIINDNALNEVLNKINLNN